MKLMTWLRQTLRHLRAFNATQVELRERWLLRNRPWEEKYLHWSWDGQQGATAWAAAPATGSSTQPDQHRVVSTGKDNATLTVRHGR